MAADRGDGSAPGAVTLPLHALVLRRRPEDLGLVPDGARSSETNVPMPMTEESITLEAALRTVSFWGLGGVFVLSGAAGVGLSVHLVPYLLERGLSSHSAAAIVGAVGFMQLPGRLLFAPTGRSISREHNSRLSGSLRPRRATHASSR